LEKGIGYEQIDSKKVNELLSKDTLSIKKNEIPTIKNDEKVAKIDNKNIFQRFSTKIKGWLDDKDVINRFRFIYLGFLALIIIGVSIPIVLFTFSTNKIIKYNEFVYFKDVIKNWNSSLINNITNFECPESEFLFQEVWEGTDKGCRCDHYVDPEGCKNTASEKKTCFYEIEEVNMVSINTWKGINLCRDKIFSNQTYFDLTLAKNASGCQTNSRSCGVIDSAKNHLCIDNGKSCPVISLEFNKKIDIQNNTNISNLNITNDEFTLKSDKGVLIYSKDEKKFANLNEVFIPIDFEISEEIPCKNTYYNNFPVIYVLDKNRGKNICLKNVISDDEIKSKEIQENKTNRLFDTDFKLVDKSYLKEEVKNNKKISKVISKLPFFEELEDDKEVFLYSKGYFGLDFNCHKEIKNNYTTDYLEKLGNELDFMKELSEIDLLSPTLRNIMLALVASYLPLLLMMFVHTKKISDSKRINSREMFYFYAFFSLVVVLITVACYVFSVVLFVVYKSHFIEQSKIFSRSDCVDPFTLELYKEFIQNINTVNRNFIANFVLMCIPLSVFGLYFFSIIDVYR